MKRQLTFSLLICGMLFSPSAFAQQFGMDTDYQTQMHQQQQAQGPAFNSVADRGSEGYHTDASAWQDIGYVLNQYAPLGNVQAPIQNSQFGAISTFKGNQGQFLKGQMNTSGQSLPLTRTGLNAINGGYTNDACNIWGSGGFPGGNYSGGGSKVYPSLPDTSTSTVDLNTAF